MLGITYRRRVSDSRRQFEFFDRFTPTYDDERLEFARRDLERSSSALDLIDVGCGDGSTMAYLGGTGKLKRLVGVDPSQAYVDQARSSGTGEFLVGSVLDDPLIDRFRSQFDRAVMASVLHHLVGTTRRDSQQNARRAVVNCLALLKPGGRLYLFEPTSTPRWSMAATFWLKSAGARVLGNRRVELGPSWANIGAPVVSYFGHEELIDLIGSVGGEVENITVVSDQRLGGVIHRMRVGYTVAVASSAPRPSAVDRGENDTRR
jgi:SAM-dependent methyltransferase